MTRTSKEIVQEQYESNKKLMDEYTDELKILLLPKDPDDDRNVIIEIRGGAGGERSGTFCKLNVQNVLNVGTD